MDLDFDDIRDTSRIRSYAEILEQEQDEEGYETATTNMQVDFYLKVQTQMCHFY